MKNQIIVGPLLGFEQGNYYTVCILTDGLAGVPQLTVAGQTIPFAKLDTVGTAQFWRAEFQPAIPPGGKGSSVKYSITSAGKILADGHDRSEWKFYVPGATEQPCVAYASCNGFSSPDLLRDSSEPYALWQKMARTHSKTPYALLLMGGDQLYADQIWGANAKTAPELAAWMQKNYADQNKAVAGAAMVKEITTFYDWLYTDRWKSKDMSLMFASIPSVMMWDDHDIFDGWGS